MTLMECLNSRKECVEAIRLQEKRLGETVRGSEEYYTVKRETRAAMHKKHELTMWLYDSYHYRAIREVLTDAFMDGDFTVPQEIIARIESKRKELIEGEKRMLEAAEV